MDGIIENFNFTSNFQYFLCNQMESEGTLKVSLTTIDNSFGLLETCLCIQWNISVCCMLPCSCRIQFYTFIISIAVPLTDSGWIPIPRSPPVAVFSVAQPAASSAPELPPPPLRRRRRLRPATGISPRCHKRVQASKSLRRRRRLGAKSGAGTGRDGRSQASGGGRWEAGPGRGAAPDRASAPPSIAPPTPTDWCPPPLCLVPSSVPVIDSSALI
jgi:hypothetical protein